jgi:hypothetical protein
LFESDKKKAAKINDEGEEFIAFEISQSFRLKSRERNDSA